nr:unnamed protein product [Naegleria fowleri]
MPRGKPGIKRKADPSSSGGTTPKSTKSVTSSSTSKGRQTSITTFCKTRKLETQLSAASTKTISYDDDANIKEREESPVKVIIPESYSLSLNIITSSSNAPEEEKIPNNCSKSDEESTTTSSTSPIPSVTVNDIEALTRNSSSNRLSPVSEIEPKSIDDEYDIFEDTTFDKFFSSTATFNANIESIHDSLKEVQETARELVELRKEIALSAELDHQIRIEMEKRAKRQSLSDSENLSKLEHILAEDGTAITFDRSLLQPSNDYDGFVTQLKISSLFEEMRRFYILKLDKCGLTRNQKTQSTLEEIKKELRHVVPKDSSSIFEWERLKIIKKHFSYRCNALPAEIKTLMFKHISITEFEKYLGRVGIQLDCTRKDATTNDDSIECIEFLCPEEMLIVYSSVQRTCCTFVNHLLKRFLETLSENKSHPNSVQHFLPFLISVYMSRHYFRPDNVLQSNPNWFALAPLSENLQPLADSLVDHSIGQSPMIMELIGKIFDLHDISSMKDVVTTILQYFRFEEVDAEKLPILTDQSELSHENLLKLIRVYCPPLFSCFIQQRPWLHKRYKNIEIVFKSLMLIILVKITNNKKVSINEILEYMTNHNTANDRIEESILLHALQFIKNLSPVCPSQKSSVFPFYYLLDNVISLMLCLDLNSIQRCMSKETLSLCEDLSKSIHSSLRTLLPKVEYNHFFLRFGDITRKIIPLKIKAAKAPLTQQTLSFQMHACTASVVQQ